MARRAKRVIWTFRLIFYPGAAIIAILLLTGSDGANDFMTLRGKTAQGREFTLWVDEDRPAQFVTVIAAKCPYGGDWYWLNWRRTDRNRVWFHDDTITGTLRMIDHRVGGEECDSGPVKFSAQR